MVAARLAAVVSLVVVVSVLAAAVNATAQDPAAIEASLALDRPTRVLIQQASATRASTWEGRTVCSGRGPVVRFGSAGGAGRGGDRVSQRRAG